ncbi:11408_t:CDS:2 [Funneliformis caledonium]|uniref:11408_t:CDS:1 n=1 Tax=Funneliformis caledonium TaxID=1117310 RepID=A0A9N9BAL8_9GLOM|nr:11408_t:CDS:2 [Funneliformis caledonium]
MIGSLIIKELLADDTKLLSIIIFKDKKVSKNLSSEIIVLIYPKE